MLIVRFLCGCTGERIQAASHSRLCRDLRGDSLPESSFADDPRGDILGLNNTHRLSTSQ